MRRAPAPRCPRGLCAVDDGDGGPALEQRVGGGEPAHADAGDEDAQPGPVGVAVGERRQARRRVDVTAPTTHSA